MEVVFDKSLSGGFGFFPPEDIYESKERLELCLQQAGDQIEDLLEFFIAEPWEVISFHLELARDDVSELERFARINGRIPCATPTRKSRSGCWQS